MLNYIIKWRNKLDILIYPTLYFCLVNYSVHLLGSQDLSIYIGLGTCLGVLVVATTIILITMLLKKAGR